MDNVPCKGTSWAVGSETLLFYITNSKAHKKVVQRIMQLIHGARTQPGTANAEKIRQKYGSIYDFKQKNQIRNIFLFQYSALGGEMI